jgi:hypothetical protein
LTKEQQERMEMKRQEALKKLEATKEKQQSNPQSIKASVEVVDVDIEDDDTEDELVHLHFTKLT